MEKKIGEILELNDKKYVVKESTEENQCASCAFSEWCESDNIINMTGDCFDRKDGKYIYFEEVK